MTTGYTPFGSVGAEYYVKFLPDANSVLQPYLYSLTSGGTETLLNGGAPLDFGISGDGKSVEVAIPQVLVTPAGGSAPSSINFAALFSGGGPALPGDFTNNPQYIYRSLNAGPGRPYDQEGRHRLFRDHRRAVFRRLAGWSNRLCRSDHGGAASGGGCRRLL
jgi:hypothetical protein